MSATLDFIGSVEVVWVVWLGCSVGTLVLTALALRGLKLPQGRSLWAEEDGAAYTLSYVMVLPFYLALVAGVVETSLVLVTKVGTVYAAYAGARAAIVARSSSGPAAGERARLAALRGFVPFASSGAATDTMDDSGVRDVALDAYLDAYQAYETRPLSRRYLGAKFGHAIRALDVAIEVAEDGSPEPELTVTARYAYPFTFGGLGRLLGERDAQGRWIYPVSSRVRLREEVPQNDERSLGITYGSL